MGLGKTRAQRPHADAGARGAQSAGILGALTGGLASITAASLLGGFSWLRWFTLMAFAPTTPCLFTGALLLRLLVGPFEPGQPIEAKVQSRQPFTAIEIKDARRSSVDLWRCGSLTAFTIYRRRSRR